MSCLRVTEPIATYTAEQQKETVINLHQWPVNHVSNL